MPYTKKLPSGNWMCQFRLDGRTRTVTAPTKKEAEFRALELQMDRRRELREGLTIGQAVRRYIDSRDNVLSPSTIAGYEKDARNHLTTLDRVYVRDFTNRDYQMFVNRLSGSLSRRGNPLSPKSVKNVCALLEAAIRFADPDVHLSAKLPPPRKQIVHLLLPEDVFSIVRGTEIELPVLLAAWLSLSMSEIRGLTVASVQDGRLIVQGSMIDVDNAPVYRAKQNKTFARTRSIDLPPEIFALIEKTDAWQTKKGFLVPLTSNGIWKRWKRLQIEHGVPEDRCMTFHQLRHLNASILEDLGIPDSVSMLRGGWASRSTLNRVYQHAITSRQSLYDKKINERFAQAYDPLSHDPASENSSENDVKNVT